MLCDDLGYSDIGPYGSEIDTPNLDELTLEGVRFTNFHVTPFCSPTRAALLTGMNHHEAGVGFLTRPDSGFPGYRSRISATAVTAAELFRHNGYATFAVGKWHLSPNDHLSIASDKSSWPLQRGFDRFYGFLWGLTNLHHPHLLHEDNHIVPVDTYPDDYFFTDDITDRALAMVRSVKRADSARPFFLYLAHGAVHAPLMAKPRDIEKYRGEYAAGWDRIRERRFARQLELGVVPSGTRLPPRNSEPGYDVPAWDSLTASERELYARYMEVYAGMVDNVDQNLGRLRKGLAELGELDNTVIIFCSDNGASREGGSRGTTEYFRTGMLVARGEDPRSFDRDWERREQIGGPRTMSHYPWGWAMASNTPFRLYKGTTFAGGHQAPLIVSWPRGLAERNAIRRQYAYVSDLLPTLIDLISLEVPREREGQSTRSMSGSSLKPTLTDANARSTHLEQYYEMRGHRGFYREGWEAVTLHYPNTSFDDDEWQLYHVGADPTQIENLAAEEPVRVTELVRAWEDAAWANQVFPLDDTGGVAVRIAADRRARPPTAITLSPQDQTLEPEQSRALIQGRSFAVAVRLTFRSGDQGVLVAHGDQGGGYVLYVAHDELVLVYNDNGLSTRIEAGKLHAGHREVVVRFDAAGVGEWDVTVEVDGEQRSGAEGLVMFSLIVPFEGIDVGIDRRSPVCWEIYEEHGSFAYTGSLHDATITPGVSTGDASRATEMDHAAAKFD